MSKTFGQFLQDLRRRKGLTQKDVARRVDIDPTYLSKVENDTGGQYTLSEESLTRMADVLEADRDELLARAGKVPSDVQRILVANFSLIAEIRSRYNEDESDESEKEA